LNYFLGKNFAFAFNLSSNRKVQKRLKKVCSDANLTDISEKHSYNCCYFVEIKRRALKMPDISNMTLTLLF